MKTFVQDWKCQVAHVPEVFANPVALIALARLVKWHQQSLSSSTLGPAMELSAVQSKHTCMALKGFFESLVNTKMSRVQMTSSHENIWIIKLDQIGACLEVGFDPSPFSWCFVAAQVGHLGKSAPWWFHVGHDTRSPSGSTAEQFRFRHCWVAVAEPQKHCTTKGTGLPFRGKKNAGSVDRFSWPSFEKVPQQALLRPSKHFWQHRSTNLHFSCAPCKMTSNDQQPYLYAYSFVVVFSLSIRYLPKKYMTWTKKACLDQSIFHQLPFNRIFNPPGAPTT